MAHSADSHGGFNGDITQFFGRRRFRHGRIGDKDGAALGQNHAHAHDAAAGRRVDDPQDFVKRLVESAGQAGHHTIGVAGRDHGGGKRVAILIDQAIRIAL